MPKLDGRRWTIPAQLANVGPMITEALSFLESQGVDAKPRHRTQLLLEEVILNVVRHGLEENADSDVRIHVTVESDGIHLVVEDSAAPFNLLDAAAPNRTLPLQQLTEGGLGIHLVKHMADDLAYERQDDQNRVHIRVAV